MRIVHIGFPKCSSKTHQLRLFPYISSKKNFVYKDHKTFSENLVKNKKIKYVKNEILSCETISGYYTSNKNKKKIYKGFLKIKSKKDITFLIIKNPLSMLQSLYFQESVYELEKISSKKFFNRHNFKDFDIIELVNLIKKKYNKLYVCKLETINRSQIYKKLFSLNNYEDAEVKKIFENNIENKSVFFGKLNNLINKIINIKKYNDFIDRMSRSKFVKSNYILRILFYFLNYKIFLQKVLSKFFRTKAKHVNLSIKQKKIFNSYSKKYSNYPNFVIYKNYGKAKSIID